MLLPPGPPHPAATACYCPQGRLTLLLGPPGCGKSSYLKVLSGRFKNSESLQVGKRKGGLGRLQVGKRKGGLGSMQVGRMGGGLGRCSAPTAYLGCEGVSTNFFFYVLYHAAPPKWTV